MGCLLNFVDYIGYSQGFKNQTGTASSTGDRSSILSGSLKKLEFKKNRQKTENRRFDHKNHESERLNQFWPGSTNYKTTPFWSFFFLILTLSLTYLFFSFWPHSHAACPSASRRCLSHVLSLHLVQAGMRKMKEDLDRWIHDQKFTAYILNVLDKQWELYGDNSTVHTVRPNLNLRRLRLRLCLRRL